MGVRALENKRIERRFLGPGVQHRERRTMKGRPKKARDVSAIFLFYLANALLEATL